MTDQISRIQAARKSVESELRALDAAAQRTSASAPRPSQAGPSSSKLVAPTSGRAVDYTSQRFEWRDRIHSTARAKWDISSFRLCQEAAINAALDNRDLVCVMPTGGGKSLIYQLPALLVRGTTVVVTPLLSLMDDQAYNLRQLGIAAEMINGTTSQEDGRAIMHRLAGTKPTNKVKAEEFERGRGGGEIKLLYVTPEKIDKSKTVSLNDLPVATVVRD